MSAGPTRHRRRRAAVVLGVSVVVAAVGGCTGTPGRGDTAVPSTGGRPVVAGTLVVSAASSLAGAFERIAADFELAHPGVRVELNADASSTLATQVLEGAPVDVFAAADEVAMSRVVDASLTSGPPEVVATNDLVIVTRPQNPDGIGSLADFTRVTAGEVVALCAPEAPCGRYAAELLAAAGVSLDESRVTRARNAAAALAAVADGDAVAGVVYASDALAAGDRVSVVTLPAVLGVEARYPIAVVATSTNPVAARAFTDWVVGVRGKAVLASFGFGTSP